MNEIEKDGTEAGREEREAALAQEEQPQPSPELTESGPAEAGEPVEPIIPDMEEQVIPPEKEEEQRKEREPSEAAASQGEPPPEKVPLENAGPGGFPPNGNFAPNMPPVPPPWQNGQQPGYYPGYQAYPPQGWAQPSYYSGYPQGGQPVYPAQQPAPVPPPPEVPGGGYGYPPQPPQYQPQAPAYYAGSAKPVKKKMSLGAKVFLWIAGLLAAGGIIGMVIYMAFMANRMDNSPFDPSFGYDFPYGGSSGPESQPPQEEDPQEEPEEEAPSRPQVDVTPNTDGISIADRPAGATLDAEAVYSRVVPSTVTVTAALTREGQTSDSTGTGIIATSDGYIITNSHVVLNSKSTAVTVTTYDGQEYDAVVVGVDRTTDLAVIKTNDHNFVPAEFGDAQELSVGEWVLALGNPGGTRFNSSLTRGIISGLDREVGKYSQGGMTYIQTDAAINPGNSGGPLVNMYGQVVGINSSKIITEGYEGMGFAIPVSKAQPIINELLSGGYIKGRTRLGIMCREISSSMSQMSGMPRGLLITEFNEDSSFAGTEAQVGDIIVAIEGEKVESLRDVTNLLVRYAPGDQVKVTLCRPSGNFAAENQELEVTIVLLEDKGETQD